MWCHQIVHWCELNGRKLTLTPVLSIKTVTIPRRWFMPFTMAFFWLDFSALELFFHIGLYCFFTKLELSSLDSIISGVSCRQAEAHRTRGNWRKKIKSNIWAGTNSHSCIFGKIKSSRVRLNERGSLWWFWRSKNVAQSLRVQDNEFSIKDKPSKSTSFLSMFPGWVLTRV